MTIGAELELIPVLATTKLPVPVRSNTGPSLSATISRCAALNGWSDAGMNPAPSWTTEDGSRISFEPGGQIEISSAPHVSCSELIRSLQRTAGQLAAAARSDGAELLTLGTDPYNDISAVPLQLESERYTLMTRYLDARGDCGVRMMRQTAALQISVEHGPKPFERWRLLNALAPYLVAIFANSSRYAGRHTGHASYRAHLWRELDESRTGLPFDALDPASRYAEFSLDAGALRAENGLGEKHAFRSRLSDDELVYDDWLFHLSTLFPEVRPKEYFEIRSPDTIAVEDVAAPLVFVAGLVYNARAAERALALLGDPNEALLRTAGKDGLGNGAIHSIATELVRLAIEGGGRLPSSYLTAEHHAQAAGWLRSRVG